MKDLKEQAIERRRTFLEAAHPYLRQMTSIHSMNTKPVWVLDEEGGLLRCEYHWTSEEAKELYEATQVCVEQLRQSIMGSPGPEPL